VAIDASARTGVMFIICTFYALCTNDAEEQFTLIFLFSTASSPFGLCFSFWGVQNLLSRG